jgi:hypothetical protein
MGEAQSLLASLVIENVKHECEHKDCKEMVHFKEIRSHEETCKHRLVRCPGSEVACGMLVSFLEVVTHAKACPAIDQVVGKTRTLSEKFFETKDDLTWKTCVSMFDAKTFFLRMGRFNSVYSLEVVLLGSQKEANKYNAEIAILDSKSKSKVKSLKSCFEPRAISQDEWGSVCFTVPEKALARLWSFNEEKKKFEFKIRVQITMNED